VRLCGDSLWAAFHSNILVRLDSNFFLISSGSNILVSFGTNFQFSLGSCGNNIWRQTKIRRVNKARAISSTGNESITFKACVLAQCKKGISTQ